MIGFILDLFAILLGVVLLFLILYNHKNITNGGRIFLSLEDLDNHNITDDDRRFYSFFTYVYLLFILPMLILCFHMLPVFWSRL
jgi:hypothetical protein